MDRDDLKYYQEILIKNLKEQFGNGDYGNSCMIESIVDSIFRDMKDMLPIKRIHDE